MSRGTTTSRRTVVAVAVVCALSLLAGTWTSIAGTGSPSLAFRGIGPAELGSAMASLAHAEGPANGAPLGCASNSAGSASCRVAAPSEDSTPPGPIWSNLTTHVVPLPSPRLSVMTWDASDGYVLLFGGVASIAHGGTVVRDDTWSYVNGTWTNLTGLVAGTPPTPILPGMAYDPWTSEVVLYGGASLTHANLSLTWTYHDRVWTNITAHAGTPPSPRVQAIFVADLASQQMILYGGAVALPGGGSGGFLDDTWLFQNDQWSNISGSVGTAPPPLFEANGVYDPAESGVLLVGTGYSAAPLLGYTYLFTGGTWQNLTPTEVGAPPTFDFPAMGYDAATSTVFALASIVFPSDDASQIAYAVDWEFHAGNWTNITPTGFFPPDGSGATIATDPSGALLLFGGLGGPASSETQWMYAYSSGPSSTPLTASPSRTDVGTPVTVTVGFVGGLSPVLTNLSFGDGNFVTGVTDATHAYSVPGTYTVEFNATDLVGRSTVTMATVTAFAAPSALVIHAGPSSPRTGESVNFTSSATGGTSPFTSAWSFGDGSTSADNSVNHTFAAGGTYTVRLTVTDADGRNASTSLALTVTSSGSNSSGGFELALIVGAVLVVALIAAAVLFARHRKGVRPPPPGPPPPGA
ncbi:MAG: PKD domain-containing protein [Thermoplasmata archaeon]